jgi:hypothetical protein
MTNDHPLTEEQFLELIEGLEARGLLTAEVTDDGEVRLTPTAAGAQALQAAEAARHDA